MESSVLTEADLYQRGIATLIASWEAYARCASHASVERHPGVTAAIFRCEPERGIYNNAILSRGLTAARRRRAVDDMQDAYAAAGVDRFAAWVHETDESMRCDLERLGFTLDTMTRAMGMPLDDIYLSQPELDLRPLDWSDYLRVFDCIQACLRVGSGARCT